MHPGGAECENRIMRKEKYIVERYSEAKGSKKTLVALQVSMHYEENGKRKNIKKSFNLKDYKSPSDAMAAAKAYRDRKAAEIVNKKVEKLPDHYSVDDVAKLIPEYFPYTKGTQVKNEKMYNKYIKPVCGDMMLVDVKQEDILKTMVDCANHCVQGCVGNVRSVWRKIYSIGIQKEIVHKDETMFVETPRSLHETARSNSEQNITEEDFKAFCEYLETYGHYMPWEKAQIYNREMILQMLKVARVAGVRPREVRALRKGDIVFRKDDDGDEYAVIRVRVSEGSSRTEKSTITTTKTRQSKRDIPVFGEVVQLLHDAVNNAPTEYIFAKYNHELFTSTEVSDYLYRVSNQCGIKVYMVLLRKSFAADLYAAGVNPTVIKQLMGHASENMSLNWYSSVGEKELTPAMKKRTELYKKKE